MFILLYILSFVKKYYSFDSLYELPSHEKNALKAEGKAKEAAISSASAHTYAGKNSRARMRYPVIRHSICVKICLARFR